jgi:hypothetical protein
MGDGRDNLLARIERPRLNYPLYIAAGVLFLAVVAGVGVAFRSENYTEGVIFLIAAALMLALVIIYQAASQRAHASDERRVIRWDAAIPELQRQNVNVEVRELARQLNVGEDSLTDLLSAYIVGEDLALRQIQQEENLPLMRHVSIGGSAFDAILIDHDLITCIEVAFLVKPDVRQEKIEAMLKKISTAMADLGKKKSRLKLRLMLVLVTQITEEEEERLRGMLTTRRFTDTPVDIDIRMLDFEELQRTYVTE